MAEKDFKTIISGRGFGKNAKMEDLVEKLKDNGEEVVRIRARKWHPIDNLELYKEIMEKPKKFVIRNRADKLFVDLCKRVGIEQEDIDTFFF